MRFVVDNQLPRALARWLSAQGHDAIHVLEISMAQTSDADICTFAADQARIIVSKDEDFLGLVLRPGVTVQFVWIRMPNCTNAALLAAIDRALARTISLLEAGHQVVEIR